MDHKNIDWKILQSAIIIFLISLIISSALVIGSWHFKKGMLADYNKSTRQFQAVSQQYLTVDEEERLIQKYNPEFLNLYERGILGGEQRLNWIETLRDVSEQIKLPTLRYVINSQGIYSPEYPINTGNFHLYNSGMQLRLDLLHEEDIFRVLGYLDEKALGVYSISGCKFTRNKGKITGSITSANISSVCDLNWFTIKNSDGSDINKL